MIQTVEKELKVGKTDTYSLTVSSVWLASEGISSAVITVDSAKVTYLSHVIIDNVIFVSLTGVSTGDTEIHFDYITPTRTDCDAFTLILSDC